MFLKQTAYKPRSNSQSSATSGSPPPETPAGENTPKLSSPTAQWGDRRFMWQKGSESSRKASFSGGEMGTVQKTSPFTLSKPNTSDNPHPAAFRKDSASSTDATVPSPALRDRHVIWTKGREVHESAAERRKSSASSATAKSGMLANLLGYSSGTGK